MAQSWFRTRQQPKLATLAPLSASATACGASGEVRQSSSLPGWMP